MKKKRNVGNNGHIFSLSCQSAHLRGRVPALGAGGCCHSAAPPCQAFCQPLMKSAACIRLLPLCCSSSTCSCPSAQLA